MSIAAALAAIATCCLPAAKPHALPATQPMQSALASYYDDTGATASGRHYTYGYASLMFGSAWGHPVTFCYERCVTGRLDDHGPYVSGRLFDLNVTLRDALGCTDLCWLRWRNWRPRPSRLGARMVWR